MPCSITPVRTGAAPSPAIVPVTFPETKPSRVNIEPARFGTGFTFRFDASTVTSHPSSVVTVCAFDSNGVGVADTTVPPTRNNAMLAPPTTAERTHTEGIINPPTQLTRHRKPENDCFKRPVRTVAIH